MAVRVQPRQLAFALPHAESLTRDNFLEGPSNEAAQSLIESWPDWPNRIMLLVGPEGSGKSHLASIWAEQAGARSISAHALDPAAVPGALATGALVVEDLRPAGFDERLMPLVTDRPKAMLEVKGKSILQRQVDALQQSGVRQIAVVRGYKKEQILKILGGNTLRVMRAVEAAAKK